MPLADKSTVNLPSTTLTFSAPACINSAAFIPATSKSLPAAYIKEDAVCTIL